MNVILDTLIFARQARGGVSEYWFEFIKRMLNDKDINLFLLNYHGKYKHRDFKMLDKKNATLIEDEKWPSQILRCVDVNPKNLNIGKFIFQSTVSSRICSHKDAVNIATIHDFTHQLRFFGFKNKLRKYLNTWQKNRLISHADGIICISNSTEKDLLMLYPKTNTQYTRVIYNGVNEEYRRVNDSILPLEYHFLKNKRYFVFIGERDGYKNFEIILKILKKNEQFICAVIGGSRFSKDENMKIKQLGNRCIRYTNVSNEDLNIIYNKAHCLIYPSLYEGFGIPLLEAMRAGCPVIALDNSSIPEVLSGSGILLKTNNVEDFTNALKKLNNKKYRTKIIQNQQKESMKFSWDKAYCELKKFYCYISQITNK